MVRCLLSTPYHTVQILMKNKRHRPMSVSLGECDYEDNFNMCLPDALARARWINGRVDLSLCDIRLTYAKVHVHAHNTHKRIAGGGKTRVQTCIPCFFDAESTYTTVKHTAADVHAFIESRRRNGYATGRYMHCATRTVNECRNCTQERKWGGPLTCGPVEYSVYSTTMISIKRRNDWIYGI